MANTTRAADVVAYLKTDKTELESGLASAEGDIESSGGKFGSILQGVGMSIGMGVAGIAMDALGKVTEFVAGSVTAASDLSETTSKIGVVFGEQSDAVLKWAETSATALGQSKQQALDAAGTFGNLFVSMGMGSDTSADMSMGLVKLAGDLASFNNQDPTEVLDKLKSGLLGQTEPLQSLGVNLTAAAVQQKALEMGLATTTDALTPAMLAQARYALILDQTKTAQGDFARTSDGLANQQRIQDAQWANLQATIGQGLLPVQLVLTQGLNQLLTAVLPPLSAFITSSVVPAVQGFSTVLGGVVQGVTKFLTGLQLGPITSFAQGGVSSFGSLGAGIQAQLSGPMAYFQAWFQGNLPRVQQIVTTVLTAIATFWQQHGQQIMTTVQNYLNWVMRFWDTMFKTLLDIITVALQLLTGDWEGAGKTIQQIVSRWWEFIRDAFNAIVRTIRNVDWGGVGRAVVNGIWDGLKAAWGGLQDWFGDRLQDWRNMLPFSEPKDPRSPLRGLTKSGAAIVEQLRIGIDSAGPLMPPGLDLAGAGGGTSAQYAITININGGGDPQAVGSASERGVLRALRAVGVR